MMNGKLYKATYIFLFALKFYLKYFFIMHKSIQLLLVQIKIDSYTCAASTVEDLKYTLFLNIRLQSYVGITEISKTS